MRLPGELPIYHYAQVGYWDKLDEHLCAALRPQPNAIVCGDFNVNIDLS